MKEKDLDKLRAKLEQEHAQLELELTDIGRINSINPNDWSANHGSYEVATADKNILADVIEETSTNNSIVNELELRFENVNNALKRIETDAYGICTECKKEIPMERLEANPAADTCIDCAD